jgi:hypothetical protein
MMWPFKRKRQAQAVHLSRRNFLQRSAAITAAAPAVTLKSIEAEQVTVRQPGIYVSAVGLPTMSYTATSMPSFSYSADRDR